MDKSVMGGLLKRQPNSAHSSRGDKLYNAINDAGTEALTKGARIWYRQVGPVGGVMISCPGISLFQGGGLLIIASCSLSTVDHQCGTKKRTFCETPRA